MGLAEEIARVRMRAKGAEINARHRRSREQAARMTAAMAPAAPIDGVHPGFVSALDQARARARDAVSRAEAKPKTPNERIDQLVREGKLPPRPGDLGVGYEPTPEEILGDLSGEQAAPEGTEDLPDAATVLAGGSPEGPAEWGPAPGTPMAQASSGAPGVPTSPPGLARPAGSVHSKRKRGK